MKRVIAIATAGMAMGALSASAGNITINDTLGPIGNGIGGENDEVELNCVGGQNWDMEAFLFDQGTKRLSMQGGYNMTAGEWSAGWGRQFYSGDIFIDVSGDAKWGLGITADQSPGVANGYFPVDNSAYNWDWAIVFGRTSYAADGGGGVLDGTYTFVNLQGSSKELEVFFDQNNQANPLRVALKSGGNYGNSYTWSSETDGEGIHYGLGGIDLSSILPSGTAFTLHYTMGCGNDLLIGQSTSLSVPDGGLTVGLMGLSLSALGFASRRLRKN
jgi:hypothetical protein